MPTTSPGHTALHHSDHFVIRSHRFAHFVTRSHSVASFCPLRHPYSPRIFYAVVRQISMLFIDNKDSVFCIRHPITQCCIILPTWSPDHTVLHHFAHFVTQSHSVVSFGLLRLPITQCCIVLSISSPDHTVWHRFAHFVTRSHNVRSFCLFRHLITQFCIFCLRRHPITQCCIVYFVTRSNSVASFTSSPDHTECSHHSEGRVEVSLSESP